MFPRMAARGDDGPRVVRAGPTPPRARHRPLRLRRRRPDAEGLRFAPGARARGRRGSSAAGEVRPVEAAVPAGCRRHGCGHCVRGQPVANVFGQGPVRPPGSRPFPNLPTGTESMLEVEHIVIYMQENHSYDSYFGMLRGATASRSRRGVPRTATPDPDGTAVPVFHAPETCQTGPRRVAELGRRRTADRRRRMDGFLVRRQHQRHALLGRTPTCRSTGRWPRRSRCATGGSRRRRRRRIPNRLYLQAGTSPGPHRHGRHQGAGDAAPRRRHDLGQAQRATASRGTTTRGTSPTSPCSRRSGCANQDKVKTFTEFLADCRVGRACRVSIVSPGVADVHRGEPDRHPARRGLQLVDHQRGHAQPGVAEARCCCSCTTSTAATTTTCPPPAAVPPDDIAARASHRAPDAPAAWNVYGLRVPAFVISPFAKPRLRVARGARPHVGAAVHRDQVQPRRARPVATPTPTPARLLRLRRPRLPRAARRCPTPGLPATGSTCQPLPRPQTEPDFGEPTPPPTPATGPVGAAPPFTG